MSELVSSFRTPLYFLVLNYDFIHMMTFDQFECWDSMGEKRPQETSPTVFVIPCYKCPCAFRDPTCARDNPLGAGPPITTTNLVHVQPHGLSWYGWAKIIQGGGRLWFYVHVDAGLGKHRHWHKGRCFRQRTMVWMSTSVSRRGDPCTSIHLLTNSGTEGSPRTG